MSGVTTVRLVDRLELRALAVGADELNAKITGSFTALSRNKPELSAVVTARVSVLRRVEYAEAGMLDGRIGLCSELNGEWIRDPAGSLHRL